MLLPIQLTRFWQPKIPRWPNFRSLSFTKRYLPNPADVSRVLIQLDYKIQKVFLGFLLKKNNGTELIEEIVKKWTIKETIIQCVKSGDTYPPLRNIQIFMEENILTRKSCPWDHKRNGNEEWFEQLTENKIEDRHRKDVPSTSSQFDYVYSSDENEDLLIVSELKKLNTTKH